MIYTCPDCKHTRPPEGYCYTCGSTLIPDRRPALRYEIGPVRFEQDAEASTWAVGIYPDGKLLTDIPQIVMADEYEAECLRWLVGRLQGGGHEGAG